MKSTFEGRIAFIGGGNMAQALIGGLLSQGLKASRIVVSEPVAALREQLSARGVHVTADNMQAVSQADVVVLAVKPQVMGEVLASLLTVMKNQLVLSIAAGLTTSTLSKMLGGYARIVRAMPNTPALVQTGATGLYAGDAVSTDDRQLAQQLLSATGMVLWVADEDGINTVIAAAGSAPAYFFLLMEAMQQSSVAMGLSDEDARLLIAQTAAGAAQMALERELPFATMRERVTSKGGTTAAALAVFQQHDFRQVVDAAMQAAVARAEEMAREF